MIDDLLSRLDRVKQTGPRRQVCGMRGGEMTQKIKAGTNRHQPQRKTTLSFYTAPNQVQDFARGACHE